METVLAIQAMESDTVPKINNLSKPLDEFLNFAMENVKTDIQHTIKTSLVFGGVNSCLLLSKYQD